LNWTVVASEIVTLDVKQQVKSLKVCKGLKKIFASEHTAFVSSKMTQESFLGLSMRTVPPK
jgi:hypothetical protein